MSMSMPLPIVDLLFVVFEEAQALSRIAAKRINRGRVTAPRLARRKWCRFEVRDCAVHE